MCEAALKKNVCSLTISSFCHFALISFVVVIKCKHCKKNDGQSSYVNLFVLFEKSKDSELL